MRQHLHHHAKPSDEVNELRVLLRAPHVQVWVTKQNVHVHVCKLSSVGEKWQLVTPARLQPGAVHMIVVVYTL